MNSTSDEGGHGDVIPAFTEESPKLDSFEIRIKNGSYKKAFLLSIEFEDERELETKAEGQYIVIKIPGNCFSGYGIVRIPL